jgi:iron complex transport system substrate-binding protein
MLGLTEELQERVDLIRHKLKFIEQKPTVAVIDTLEPLALAGNPAPEMVDIAGGIPISGPEALQQQNPDIIIIIPKGFSIEQTMRNIDLLLQLPGFTDIQAVKNNRLYIADGIKYLNGPNANVVDTVELLAEIINPKQFIFGYEGEGWIRFSL